MREYAIKRSAVPLPTLSGVPFDPASEPFCAGAYAPIDIYAWGGDYRPEARAYVAWDDGGLQVLLCAREAAVSTRVTDFNGDVWTDSCLEFFLRPFVDDARYVNIEVNAAGAALIGLGKALAKEVAPEGIRVHVISPGGVFTDMVRVARPDLTEEGMIVPEEIAELAAFLIEHRHCGVIDEIQIHRTGKEPFL